VEWFDSSVDIVDVTSPSGSPENASVNRVRQTSAKPTNDGSAVQNIKQSEATATGSSHGNKGQKGPTTEAREPNTSEPSFNNPHSSTSAAALSAQEFLSFDLTPEELQFYSDAFLTSDTAEQPATISPSLLLAPLTSPPSSPASAPEFTITTPEQDKKTSKDTAAMDYSFLAVNPTSELYIPDNFVYVDNNAYVIDMAKSYSAPSHPAEVPPKKRRRVPEALNLAPAVSNKRKRPADDDMGAPVGQEQYKRPRLQTHFSSMDDIHSFSSTRSTLNTSTESVQTPFAEPTYYIQSDFSPYDTVMSCYNGNQAQYDPYVMPSTPYPMQFTEQQFHSPPVSPFESMGWYAPTRPYMQKTQQAVWNTPRTLPQQYPISPAPTPQKKQKDLRRLSLARNPAPRIQPMYPLSPPHSAPPYPVTQQHLDPHDGGIPVTPPKKDGKKGRKGRNQGGGMFINFTADDRDTILSGVAPSGSSKAKKEKKNL